MFKQLDININEYHLIDIKSSKEEMINYIKNSDIISLERLYVKPTRNMIEKELKIIYHQDNSFDKFYTYNINKQA